MSSNDLTDGDPRIAIGDLLLAKWNVENVGGYELVAPSVQRDAAPDKRVIGLTLQQYVDVDRRYPQVVIADISTTATPFGWAGDGSGPVDQFDGRVDVQCHTGGADDGDVPGGESPTKLAHSIALEVRSICRSEPQGLPMSHSLTVLSGPTDRGGLEEDGNARYDVEVGYEQLLKTPQR